jgi:hypothetical protein
MHSGLDEGGRTGAGATGVVAGLERDDSRRTASSPTGASEGIGLGVWGAGTAVPALGHDVARRGEEHAADTRVRPQGKAGLRGKLESPHHRLAFGHDHTAIVAAQRWPGTM